MMGLNNQDEKALAGTLNFAPEKQSKLKIACYTNLTAPMMVLQLLVMSILGCTCW
jgi:hypothetical protein